MRLILSVVILAVSLSACGHVADYQPNIQDVTDQAILDKDKSECLAHAKAYQPGISATNIATAATKAAGNNAAAAVLNPLVPAAGALGAGGSELLSELNLLDDKKRRVFLKCLEHRGERSRAYNVMDPNE